MSESSDSYSKRVFDSTTYEGRRHMNKNGYFAGVLLFFKSTVGLGLIINQYFIGKAGLVLGNFITLFLVVFIGYTLDQTLIVANSLERKNRKLKIQGFDEVSGLVLG